MRYKLIKEYPGSPKLGTILTHEELQYCNWDEYYEEIVEKDYEILSLIEDKFIYLCDKYSKDYIHQLFNTIGVNIHSVKRLSDGEIFTIGDFVNDRTISSFSINWMEPGFKVHCDDVGKGNINDGCFFELQDLKKLKQPLFTTEDGVDIFEGDEVTWLFRDELKIAGTRKADKNMYTDLKYFSKKEKAEEHILMNKPCLSINDLQGYLHILVKSKSLTTDLKKLVQQKLNK